MQGDIKPQVCVVGLGYIGLPTAAVIARSGSPVLGLDVTQSVVDTINRGEIHIEEVDLDGWSMAWCSADCCAPLPRSSRPTCS